MKSGQMTETQTVTGPSRRWAQSRASSTGANYFFGAPDGSPRGPHRRGDYVRLSPHDGRQGDDCQSARGKKGKGRQVRFAVVRSTPVCVIQA
jgi:hypothetical protein